jgi:hypothetical protein
MEWSAKGPDADTSVQHVGMPAATPRKPTYVDAGRPPVAIYVMSGLSNEITCKQNPEC